MTIGGMPALKRRAAFSKASSHTSGHTEPRKEWSNTTPGSPKAPVSCSPLPDNGPRKEDERSYAFVLMRSGGSPPPAGEASRCGRLPPLTHPGLTSILRSLARWIFGRRTVSTPSVIEASIWSVSTVCETLNWRS